MVKKMYRGAEFSPDATLAVGMTATDTEAQLTTTAYLPDAPNIAVIYDTSFPEVVHYTTKTGTPAVISGLTRGLSVNGSIGGAHSHAQGTVVFSGDTAYEQHAEIENIEYLFAHDAVGVEWNRGATDTTALTLIDITGDPITSLPFSSFDAHVIWHGIRRCTMAPNGAVAFGTNARGDGLTLSGSTGRVMTAIPKYYVKAEQPTSSTYRWWVSPKPMSGFQVHPAFLQRGGIERDFIHIGSYAAALNYRVREATTTGVATRVLHSYTGVQPLTGEGAYTVITTTAGRVAPTIGEIITGGTSAVTARVVDYCHISGTFATGDAVGEMFLVQVSGAFTTNEALNGSVSGATMATITSAAAVVTTPANGRLWAEAIGPGWGLLNPWSASAYRLLMLIEYASFNLPSKIGLGVTTLASGTGFAGVVNGYGSLDSQMGTNGTGMGTGTNGATPIAWRGIENPWGNVEVFIDGMLVNGTNQSVAVIPTDGKAVVSATNPRPWEAAVGTMPTADGYVTDILFEALTKYLFLPKTVGGSTSSYLCDMSYRAQATDSPAWLGGSWKSLETAGPFRLNMTAGLSASPTRTQGYRLEYIGPHGVTGTQTITTPARVESLFPPPVTTATTPTGPYAAWSDPANSGTKEWLCPMKILRQDGGATTVAAGASGTTHWLKAQGYGFRIPANATITDIVIDVYRYAAPRGATNYVRDIRVCLIRPGGVNAAANVAQQSTDWLGAADVPELRTYTGAMGAETWTPAIVNHGDFGVCLSAAITTDTDLTVPAVDFIGIRVTYTV